MSEDTAKKNLKEDEIDLLDLFKRIGITLASWAKSIGRGILISIVFLFRNFIPLAISIIVGVGTSYLFKATSESTFTSDMVIRNNVLMNTDMIAYVNRLHTYSIEGNSKALEDALSCNPQVINNIIDISAFYIIDNGKDGYPDYVDYKNNHNIYDSINVRMADRMNVRIRIKMPQELTLVKEGLIKYIESDSLFQQKNRVRVKQNRDMLARLDYDILQLDSLQKIKYYEETKSRYPDKGGQMVFLQEQKTQLVYTDIYALYAKKQALEGELDLYKELITILSDLTVPVKRSNGTYYYAKKFIPLFFLLTLFVLIVIANREKIKEIYKKY